MRITTTHTDEEMNMPTTKAIYVHAAWKNDPATVSRLHATREHRAQRKQRGETSSEGYVYMITNPVCEEWVTIGKARDCAQAVGRFNEFSPHADYKLLAAFYFPNYHAGLSEARKRLRAAVPFDHEWFRAPAAVIASVIEAIPNAKRIEPLKG